MPVIEIPDMEIRNFKKAAKIAMKRLYEEGCPYLQAIGWQMHYFDESDAISLFRKDEKAYVDIRQSDIFIYLTSATSTRKIPLTMFKRPFDVSMTGSLYELLRCELIDIVMNI